MGGKSLRKLQPDILSSDVNGGVQGLDLNGPNLSNADQLEKMNAANVTSGMDIASGGLKILGSIGKAIDNPVLESMGGMGDFIGGINGINKGIDSADKAPDSVKGMGPVLQGFGVIQGNLLNFGSQSSLLKGWSENSRTH